MLKQRQVMMQMDNFHSNEENLECPCLINNMKIIETYYFLYISFQMSSKVLDYDQQIDLYHLEYQ